jgi:hypothetical protein
MSGGLSGLYQTMPCSGDSNRAADSPFNVPKFLLVARLGQVVKITG